mmetsp:Transcript_15729/g.26244  ORF Transcript_15729/g.26244 Transcript_15729/m.26244 type:complete len:233 (+) Transcript_15729:161-859(+)
MTVPNDVNKNNDEKPKEHLITKILKVYSYTFNGMRQSLMMAKKNRKEHEEREIAASMTDARNSNDSTTQIGANLIMKRETKFDYQGFGAIVIISFLSTGFLFAMKKYIFKPGEFWKQGSGAAGSDANRQRFTYRAYHNHNSNGSGGSSNSGGSTPVFNHDQMIKSYLSVLGLPLHNLRPSVQEVKQAYRKICLRTHPDVVESENMKSKKYLEERFIMATKAHDELLQVLGNR